MADKRRLVALGVPTQQAEELAKQIDEGGGAGQALTVAERAEGKADTALIDASEAQADADAAFVAAQGAKAPPFVPFANRAAAIGSSLTTQADYIDVNGLRYVKQTGATALVTAGGAFAPLGEAKFEHFGLTLTENANNDAAISVMLDYIGPTSVLTIPKGTFNAEIMSPAYGVGPGTTHYHLRSGSLAVPSMDIRPMIRMEKVASPLDADGIAQLMALHMRVVSGTKGGAALTVEADSMETSGGAALPIHMRGKTGSATASGWGGWAYMDVQGARPLRAIGFEVNLRVNLADNPIWSPDGKASDIDGLVVSVADSGTNNKANSAIRIAKSLPHTDDKGFMTGIQLASRALLPSDAELNGEVAMINGVDQNVQRYGGIRFGHGTRNRFHYAFRTNEAVFNNNVAFWLGSDQRIRWGDTISSGPYLALNSTVSRFQFVGAALEVSTGASSAIWTNGIKVVGIQQPAISDALTSDQKIASILTAMRAHGLIAVE